MTKQSGHGANSSRESTMSRHERLRQALRENLKRRKEQKRRRAQHENNEAKAPETSSKEN